MKPYGVTIGLQVVRPSETEDAIWAAVESAVNAGWTPERFKNELASAWEDALRDQIRHAKEVLR